MQIWSSGGLKRDETGEVVQLAAVSENKATPFQDSFYYHSLVEYPRPMLRVEVMLWMAFLVFLCTKTSFYTLSGEYTIHPRVLTFIKPDKKKEH